MSDESQDSFAAMAGPAAEHQLFAPLVGTFRAEVRMWMGPGEPTVLTGTMVNSMDLGGRFLRQEYKGDPGGGPFPDFEGRGFFGFNTHAGRFEGVWIDTASTIMQVESGEVDDSGRVWTMTGEIQDPSGGTTAKRSVIRVEDDDHHSMETFFSKEGQEFKGMEIRYTRAG